MQLVPSEDKFAKEYGYSKMEMNILVASIYVTTALFLIQLIFCCYNIWAFLIQQKKYKTTPLLMFYALAVLLTLSRIWEIIFVLKFEMETNIFNSLQPFLKIEMGFVQCWILFELSLLIQ